MKNKLTFSLYFAFFLLASCNESEEWSANISCTDNETRCDNDKLLSCSHSEWIIAQNCAEIGKICGNNADLKAACINAPAGACVPACKNEKVVHCDSNGLSTLEECAPNQTCGLNANGVPACIAQIEVRTCTPSCKNGILTKCDSEMNSTTSTCNENEVCGFDENGLPSCVNKPDAVICAFGQTNLLIGETACDDNGKVVTCQADGTLSDGTPCVQGVCNNGECVLRDCDGLNNGKSACRENKRMICNDGTWVEDEENACAGQTPLCRDGEFECSAYNDCDSIKHGQNGCKDGNIVLCNDGQTTVIDDGNCVNDDKICIADSNQTSGFACKIPDPGDCEWDGGLIAKNTMVCDGNTLRTCSAEKDGVINDGIHCEDTPSTPVCDSNYLVCRPYFNCGNDDEISHDSIVCNEKGTNKAKCLDGKLIDLTGDDACPTVSNASSVCTFDTEATCTLTCNTGYTLVENTCQAIVTCDPVKEIYNQSTNTCACNEAAFWTGSANACECKPGYLNIGNECVEKKVCSSAHNILDETTNQCVCDTQNHWIGTTASCQCENGFVMQNDTCQAVTTCSDAHSIWLKDSNSCICDTSGHWTKNPGSDTCICSDGYVQIGTECRLKRTCNTIKEKYIETTNTCECNADNFWTGDAGNCTCISGKVQVGNICQSVTSCEGKGQIYIQNANICACDSKKGWIGDGNTCHCPDEYIEKDGTCTPKAVCNRSKEIYIESSNTCECNIDNFWTKKAGTCQCIDGKVEVDGKCVDKLTCNSNDNKVWEAPNQCVCKRGTVLVDDQCVGKVTCNDAKGEMWAAPNQCVCKNGSTIVNQEIVCKVSCGETMTWSAPNQCICQNGYLLSNNKCTNTFKAGDIITFGYYDQKQIEWIVLEDSDASNNNVFLLSKKVLIDKYEYSTYSNEWGYSSIRYFLNHDFFDQTFSTDEKSRIVSTELTDVPKDFYDNIINDKIYLLSKAEYEQYRDTVTGVEIIDLWWLRTQADDPNKTYAIDSFGDVKSVSYDNINDYDLGIRPVMNINKTVL